MKVPPRAGKAPGAGRSGGIDMQQLTRAAVAYWRWNERAFQSIKVNLGYWVAASCAAYLLVAWWPR